MDKDSQFRIFKSLFIYIIYIILREFSVFRAYATCNFEVHNVAMATLFHLVFIYFRAYFHRLNYDTNNNVFVNCHQIVSVYIFQNKC